MNNTGCATCTLEPPPDILHIPPPPFPAILQQSSDFYPHTDLLSFPPHLNDSPCKHFCDRRSEGVQYIEMPQQGLQLHFKFNHSICSFIFSFIFSSKFYYVTLLQRLRKKRKRKFKKMLIQYVKFLGTVFDDTWLLVLLSSCAGVIFIGIVLAILLLKCKL